MGSIESSFILGFLVGYWTFLFVYRKRLSGEKTKQTIEIEFKVDSKHAIEKLAEIQEGINEMKRNAGIL